MKDPADSSATICRRVVYAGRVQGVGFRYTAHSIARRSPVSGYVKNLADGTVELVVQGRADVIESFLDEINRRFEGHITDCDVREMPVDAGRSRFSIHD
ncbi:MAG: acylphosphatase [Planctomycetaceae bacterium]